MARPSRSSALPLTYVSELPRAGFLPDAVPGAAGVVESGGLLLDGAGASAAQHQGPEYSGHASVQTSGFSLTLRNRGKGGWARDLRGRRQNCLPLYSAGVKSRSVVLGYPS